MWHDCLIRRNVAQLLNFYVQVKKNKKCCFKCACIVRIKNNKQTTPFSSMILQVVRDTHVWLVSARAEHWFQMGCGEQTVVPSYRSLTMPNSMHTTWSDPVTLWRFIDILLSHAILLTCWCRLLWDSWGSQTYCQIRYKNSMVRGHIWWCCKPSTD